MDISVEVANIHIRTGAMNLVTTARTKHSLEQTETIHMIPMLRKEACSVSILDLAHIPTQTCLANCLTKASAKADNLITAVKTKRFPDVDIHTDFRTLMEHEAFLSTWCRTFMHTKEKDVCFLNTLKIPLSPGPREGPFHVMFVRNQHIDERMDFTRMFENQDAAKITSASGDARINFSWNDYVTLGDNIVFTLGSNDIFLSVSPLSFSVVTMLLSISTGVNRMNNSFQEPIFEDYDCPFHAEYFCKEEEQCDSEVVSEDDGWPGTENQ